MSMNIVEGVVNACGLRKWTNESTGETGETFQFAIGGWQLIPDQELNTDDLPPVGTHVRAVVNKIYSKKNKREYMFVLGFQPNGNSV